MVTPAGDNNLTVFKQAWCGLYPGQDNFWRQDIL
jgi:hypothetical protein